MLNSLRKIKQKITGTNPHYVMEPWRDPKKKDQIIRDFHGLYYDSFRNGLTWSDTWFLGAQTEKCPLDLWLYQELIFKLKPDVIIETGTRFGGSAFFIASICDLIDNGKVVTIDVDNEPLRPDHNRITYFHGSSIDSAIVDKVHEICKDASTVMVFLDSDHSEKHVLDELNIYSNLVTVGSYLIVEDSNINGHPVLPNSGPGPMEAIEKFLEVDTRYNIDSYNEKFLFSFSPNGFLKRIN